MRLLHTSDWHLGQTLHQFERSHEHQQFLAWLLATLVDEAVDVLLIAGDIFDTANPSSAAQARFYQFLTEARRRLPGLNIVITAGNHDSPGRLEAPAPFLALFDATVIGDVGRRPLAEDVDRLVVPLRDGGGEVKAWCIAMPFLRPADVPRQELGEGGEGGNPYAAGVASLYQEALALAEQRRQPGQAIIAMGHCHLTGGQVSDESERSLVIGGSESLSAAMFAPAIAYVALGHLHLAQVVGKDETRRYSGSPLPLSFSEINYPHQVVLVDLAGEAVGAIRAVPVPRAVELLRVPPQPAPLAEVLAALAALPVDGLADGDPANWPYLQVRVLLTQPEPGLRAAIDAAIADLPLRLARIETSYAKREQAELAETLSIDELSALAPTDFFQRLYQHHFQEAAPAELLAAFSELAELQADSPASSGDAA